MFLLFCELTLAHNYASSCVFRGDSHFLNQRSTGRQILYQLVSLFYELRTQRICRLDRSNLSWPNCLNFKNISYVYTRISVWFYLLPKNESEIISSLINFWKILDCVLNVYYSRLWKDIHFEIVLHCRLNSFRCIIQDLIF